MEIQHDADAGFITWKIPRGRAKSPDAIELKGEMTQETLLNHLEKTKAIIKALDELPPNHFFEHPIFGKLNVKPTITFLEIHTRHHLAIIKYILSNKA